MGKKTIELYDISKAYHNVTLFEPFSYILLSTDRIGIVGHNGCGKSTLLNILTGKLPPDTGYVDMGTTMKIGYFSQENESLNPNLTVLQYVRDTAEYIETKEGTMSASAMCEQFLFDGSMQYTRIEKLSGGEKRRLYLLKVLMEAPNVLILDEPTNDLDIQTLTILENYLEDYPGIVVTVSHDRYFLDKIATRIFSFENGKIARYEGNYSDFKAAQKERGIVAASSAPGKGNIKTGNTAGTSSDAAASVAPNAADSKATWKQRESKLKFSYKEQKEYETIDADIAALEEKIANLETEIAGAATEYSRLTALMAEKEQAEAALEEKMDRWVYLNDLAEQIEAAKK